MRPFDQRKKAFWSTSSAGLVLIMYMCCTPDQHPRNQILKESCHFRTTVPKTNRHTCWRIKLGENNSTIKLLIPQNSTFSTPVNGPIARHDIIRNSIPVQIKEWK